MKLVTLVPDADYRPDAYEPGGVMADILAVASRLRPGSIVAFHGRPGSGKTPSARWLCRQLACSPIHLDECRQNQPDGALSGFDEEAMRYAISNADVSKIVVVDGVCACRVCAPAVLVTVGQWPGASLTKSLTKFIGDYDPQNWRGTVATFRANFIG